MLGWVVSFRLHVALQPIDAVWVVLLYVHTEGFASCVESTGQDPGDNAFVAIAAAVAVYIHIHTHIHIHTYTYTHMSTYIHT